MSRAVGNSPAQIIWHCQHVRTHLLRFIGNLFSSISSPIPFPGFRFKSELAYHYINHMVISHISTVICIATQNTYLLRKIPELLVSLSLALTSYLPATWVRHSWKDPWWQFVLLFINIWACQSSSRPGAGPLKRSVRQAKCYTISTRVSPCFLLGCTSSFASCRFLSLLAISSCSPFPWYIPKSRSKSDGCSHYHLLFHVPILVPSSTLRMKFHPSCSSSSMKAFRVFLCSGLRYSSLT